MTSVNYKQMLDILVTARELIAKPENFTTQTSARDSEDNRVNYRNESACKFCSMGALHRTLVKKFDVLVPVSDIKAHVCMSLLAAHTDNPIPDFDMLSNMIENFDRYGKATTAIEYVNKCTEVTNYNDAYDHRDVLKLWDRTIEYAKMLVDKN